MSAIRWENQPSADESVMIIAFEGWNDAGDAATTAVEFLQRTWDTDQVGDIDPEDFYDFTAQRPQVHMVDGITRAIEWPGNLLHFGTVDGRSVVLLDGTEPHLKWRTFCETVIGVARDLNVEIAVTLGALIADVPHTQPVPITGTAVDPNLAEELQLNRSRYEGPTGIVGVLHDAFNTAGIRSASLWAAVPHYVSQNPSPRAALALITRTLSLLNMNADVTELEIAAAEYDRQVDDVLENDPEAQEYVRSLEDHFDDDDDEVEDEVEVFPDFNKESLVAEAENFLRTQRDEDGPPTPPTEPM